MRIFLILLLVLPACKPRQNSLLASSVVPSAQSIDGFIRPKAPEEFIVDVPTRSFELTTAHFQLALMLDPIDMAEKSAFVSHSRTGETFYNLYIDKNSPSPAYSISMEKDASGKSSIYQWSELVDVATDGKINKKNIFIRHEVDSSPKFAPENTFVMRFPHGESGIEPLLIPWTHHLKLQNGPVYYRVGNSMVLANSDIPVMTFDLIGRYVWRLRGPYSDDYHCDGSIFWNDLDRNGQPTEFYWSISKNPPKYGNIMKHWRTSDDTLEFIRNVTKESEFIPKAVLANLDSCPQKDESPEFIDSIDLSQLQPHVVSLSERPHEPPVDLRRIKSPSFVSDDRNTHFILPGDEEDDSSLSLLSETNATKFAEGRHYKPGALVQAPDGTIHKIVRTIRMRGWFSRVYYNYDSLNDSSWNKYKKKGQIAYRLDHKGRVITKKHITTLASEVVKELKQLDSKRGGDMKEVARQQEANLVHLKVAESFASQVDTPAKLFAIIVTNYAFDQLGGIYGAKLVNAGLPFKQRLISAGILTGTTVVASALLDVVNSPDKQTMDRVQTALFTGATTGGANAVYAYQPGVVWASFIGGVSREAALKIIDETRGIKSPAWLSPKTLSRLVISGASAAMIGSMFAKSAESINAQGLDPSGPAAAAIRSKTLMKVRALGGGIAVARLYFQDNLTASATAGTLLETAAWMIPSTPVTGIPKALATTAAKQITGLLQLTENLARSSGTSQTIDQALDNVNNLRDSGSAIAVLEEQNPDVFKGLEHRNNGLGGIPYIIDERRPSD